MDAPISITLAHLIIIWTLTLLLVAWMLVFAILALRPTRQHTPHQDTEKGNESMGDIHTPRASVAPQLVTYTTTPAINSMHHREAATTSNEIPATPVM